MDSCENSKSNDENRYLSSYVWGLLTFLKEKKKISAFLAYSAIHLEL